MPSFFTEPGMWIPLLAIGVFGACCVWWIVDAFFRWLASLMEPERRRRDKVVHLEKRFRSAWRSETDRQQQMERAIERGYRDLR